MKKCYFKIYVKDMNFFKDNYIKTVGQFIHFRCVEIPLYKKCTKPIYKLNNTKKESIYQVQYVGEI